MNKNGCAMDSANISNIPSPWKETVIKFANQWNGQERDTLIDYVCKNAKGEQFFFEFGNVGEKNYNNFLVEIQSGKYFISKNIKKDSKIVRKKIKMDILAFVSEIKSAENDFNKKDPELLILTHIFESKCNVIVRYGLSSVLVNKIYSVYK